MDTIRRIILLLLFTGCLNGYTQTWSIQESNFDSALLNVCFVNPETGYVCGLNGKVLKTTNGGSDWNALNTNVKDGLACIQFINENIGFASGGFIGGEAKNCTMIKTTDGGNTWNKLNVATGKCGGGSYFINADTGFYAYADDLYGHSVIARTTDGGTTWNQVYSGSGWISYFHFPDSKNGYATVNNDSVLKTTDAGLTWTLTSLGVKTWGSGIYFFDKDNGIVGGKTNTNAAMFKTTNGGINWTPVESSNMIFKISFGDADHGYALSVDNYGAGTMIKSSDGGNSWGNETTPKNNLRGIQFLNKDLGYAVGDSGVILKYGTYTSIKDSKAAKQQNCFIYPNPASEKLYIGSEIDDHKTKVISIYNSTGIKVKHFNLNPNQKEVCIQDLSNGIYIVEIFSNGNSSRHELIIQN